MMLEGTDYIHDYRGSAVYVGDEVAVYYGYGTLMTAKVIQIKNNRAKLEVYYSNGEKSISKWKYGKFKIGNAYGMIWEDGICEYMNAFNIFSIFCNI